VPEPKNSHDARRRTVPPCTGSIDCAPRGQRFSSTVVAERRNHFRGSAGRTPRLRDYESAERASTTHDQGAWCNRPSRPTDGNTNHAPRARPQRRSAGRAPRPATERTSCTRLGHERASDHRSNPALFGVCLTAAHHLQNRAAQPSEFLPRESRFCQVHALVRQHLLRPASPTQDLRRRPPPPR
jgi:hypothetical protein